MKRIILSLALLMVATVAMAQTDTKSAERKAARQVRQKAQTAATVGSLSLQSFVFYPESYTLPFQSSVMLYNTGYFYLDFYPKSADMFLPFAVDQQNAIQFDATFVPYTNYKVFKINEANYIVTADFDNISNSLFTTLAMQGLDLNIHLSVNVVSGVATLTITPQFAGAVTYQGIIKAHVN